MSKLEIAERRRRIVECVQVLGACSPETLADLAAAQLAAAELCPCVEACDACAARGAVAQLAAELAEVGSAGASSDVLDG
jgi:hypothetical protein